MIWISSTMIICRRQDKQQLVRIIFVALAMYAATAWKRELHDLIQLDIHDLYVGESQSRSFIQWPRHDADPKTLRPL